MLTRRLYWLASAVTWASGAILVIGLVAERFGWLR